MLWSSSQIWNWLHPYSVGFILRKCAPSSPSTVGFITHGFHALISRQHSQTNRRGLYTLFLTSKTRCMQAISSVDALRTTQNVLCWSGRFGGGHTGWSQLQIIKLRPLQEILQANLVLRDDTTHLVDHSSAIALHAWQGCCYISECTSYL